MLLNDRNAVIYGAGAIGAAVAEVFAREGARVFVAGRNRAKLDRVADAIASAGGQVETAELDVLDERAVDRHAADIAEHARTSCC